MRPELDETLAAPGPVPDPSPTATATARPSRAPPADRGTGLAHGQQLGHFRIEKLLGAGGMGEVYLATDLALDRPVAIKVLPVAVARDATSRDRMVREARAQARINHPNIGHIYFIGEEAGRLYFAMEYVAGETVAARLAAGPLPVEDALAIVRSAALGLREAERNGITHRDIKPSNLMIDGHGMVKVLDFGLAAGATGPDGALAPGPVAQTSLGGTPLYMAPEQARGEPVDFRADIYALGATLFHLVAGRPPFEADSLDALLSKHATAARPAVPQRSGEPKTTIAAIDALCSRMMAPAAADRFASYDELIRAIELASVEHVRPAGFWVRSMATLVDLIVLGLAAAAAATTLEFVFDFDVELGPVFLLAYALLEMALVARNGHTLGQWLFELEVIDAASGRRPALGPAFVRAGVPLSAAFVITLLPVPRPLFAVALLAPPLALFWASLRSLGKQTIWDRLSHTLVRYRTRRTTAI